MTDESVNGINIANPQEAVEHLHGLLCNQMRDLVHQGWPVGVMVRAVEMTYQTQLVIISQTMPELQREPFILSRLNRIASETAKEMQLHALRQSVSSRSPPREE